MPNGGDVSLLKLLDPGGYFRPDGRSGRYSG
jgi:hypothetical protein